ncbi:LPS export ABC transporter permease LptF [Pseudodesulfovibrio sp. S3]|uniref:LPS export ABC transporter permease LptF n=1 Tax=unclassified Pseudodesulfovibrio TaxID=2661612 RepID=UPI000FEB9F1B|nr:LPS export ABC transporter permease LptF [Pseudodesulfovibrio sp. S3]MCJ2163821.1 LPS export ABC transporter permease LptF [Pseudodesulfovibrio sp. S3-i]RWU05932.1 LPS export ABC transporter permease LptF [Pseudodesulfovibrio sp. S3]
MKLLQRQIFFELLKLFGLTVSCLLGLILIGRMLQLRSLFLSQNIGFFNILQLFFFLTPFFLLLIAPIATMLSVFLTFLRMSTDNELIALKASGVSLYRMLSAPAAFCALATLFTFFISFWGLAWGMDMFKTKLYYFAKTHSKFALQPGVFNKEFPGVTFYAHQVDNEKGELKFVFVRDESIKGTSVVVVAPEAQIVSKPEQAEIRIVFKNGNIFRESGEELNVLKFGKYSIKLDLGKLLMGFNFTEEKAKDMPFFRLSAIRSDPGLMPDQDERFFKKVDTEYFKRLTLPLGCFILGMFAIPIASVFRGLKQQYGLLLAMGLFMVYYTMFSIGVSMGESGTIPAIYGMWAPNVLFVFVALIGMRYANLERTPTVILWLMHLRFRKEAEA